MTKSRSDRTSIALWIGYAALTAFGVIYRWPLLDPNSLWFDDQWVATLVRFAGAGELLEYKATVPMGFVAALKLGPLFVEDLEIALQTVPMLCALVAPVLLGLLITRLTGFASLGFLAAVLLAVNPLAAGYSMRIKQFSFDALFVTGALAIGLPLLRGTARLPWTSALAAGGMAVITYVSAFVSLPLLHVAALRAWMGGGVDRAKLLASIGALDGFVLFLFWFRIRHQSRTGVVEFWMERGGLPASQSPGALLDYFLFDGIFLRGIAGALPALPKIMAAALAGAALLFLLREARTRWAGIFFLGFYAQQAIAAGLRIYPFGGDRSDIFSYPVTLSLVMLALGSLFERLREQAPQTAATARRIALASAIALPLAALSLEDWRPNPYVANDDAQLVATLEARAQVGDVVVISHQARYAVATYGSWPMTYLQPDDRKFWVAVDRPRTHIAPGHTAFETAWIDRAHRVLYLHLKLDDRTRVFRDATEAKIGARGFARVERIDARGGSLSIFQAIP